MGIGEWLSGGRFLIAVELSPPKGTELGRLVEAAARLKGRVDVVEVADHPEAVVGASALAAAARLSAVAPPLALRLNCRDRNRIALQGEMLGAAILGLEAVVLERGRDPAYGDHPNARHVSDLDLVGLAGAAAALRAGHDLAGMELDGTFQPAVGAEIDFWAEEGTALERARSEAARLAEKGVAFLQTPPVYDHEAFAMRASSFEGIGLPVVAGVGLLKGVGMARYINRHIPGGKIPEALVRRIQKAPEKREESVRIAAETVRALKDLCAGVCLLPYGWVRLLPALVQAIEEG